MIFGVDTIQSMTCNICTFLMMRMSLNRLRYISMGRREGKRHGREKERERGNGREIKEIRKFYI